MMKVNLNDILKDESGKLREYAEKHNINFDADRFFVAHLFFKEHNIDLVDLIFSNVIKNLN